MNREERFLKCIEEQHKQILELQVMIDNMVEHREQERLMKRVLDYNFDLKFNGSYLSDINCVGRVDNDISLTQENMQKYALKKQERNQILLKRAAESLNK